MGRSGKLEQATEKAKELKAEYERVKAYLEKEMK
jgi:hypothetical protein